MSTYMPKPGEIKADWHVVDATGQVLGRLGGEGFPDRSRGSTSPPILPHVDTGDFVIVLNADKIRVTGKKADVLEYDTYSRYPGGRRVYSYKTMKQDHPGEALRVGPSPHAAQEQAGSQHPRQGEDLQGRQARAFRPAAQTLEVLTFRHPQFEMSGLRSPL